MSTTNDEPSTARTDTRAEAMRDAAEWLLDTVDEWISMKVANAEAGIHLTKLAYEFQWAHRTDIDA